MSHNGDVYALLAAQLDRNADLEDLVKKLFRRLEIQQTLLNSAVHELAAVATPKGTPRAKYVNVWYQEHRIEEVFFDA